MIIGTTEWQIGKETTWSTSVAGALRQMLVQEGVLTPKTPAKVLRAMRGSLGPGTIGIRTSTHGEGNQKITASYEDINEYFENMFGIVVPTGAGPYVRVGNAPLTAAAYTPRIFTLIKGDAVLGVYKLEGALIDELTLACEQNENDNEMTLDIKWVGKDVVTGALAALTDRIVLPIQASDFVISVDLPGVATFATPLALTAYAFELKLKRNPRLKPYLGQLTPGGVDYPVFVAEDQSFKLMMEANVTSKGFLDAINSAAVWQKNIRLKAINGASIFQLDLGVQAKDSPDIFPDQDDVASIEVECDVIETPGLANWLKYSNTCGVAVLAA